MANGQNQQNFQIPQVLPEQPRLLTDEQIAQLRPIEETQQPQPVAQQAAPVQTGSQVGLPTFQTETIDIVPGTIDKVPEPAEDFEFQPLPGGEIPQEELSRSMSQILGAERTFLPQGEGFGVGEVAEMPRVSPLGTVFSERTLTEKGREQVAAQILREQKIVDANKKIFGGVEDWQYEGITESWWSGKGNVDKNLILDLDDESREEFLNRDTDITKSIFDLDPVGDKNANLYLEGTKKRQRILDETEAGKLERARDIYAQTDELITLESELTALDQQLGNEIKTEEELKERKLAAMQKSYESMASAAHASRGFGGIELKDFTYEEGINFFNDAFSKYDDLVQKTNDRAVSNIVLRSQAVKESYERNNKSSYRFALDNQYTQSEVTFDLANGMRETLLDNIDIDGNLPNGTTLEEHDIASNQIIQQFEITVEPIFGEIDSLFNKIESNKDYFDPQEYEQFVQLAENIRDKYTVPYVQAWGEIAQLQHKLQLEGSLSPRQARAAVNKHYEDQGFDAGIQGFLASKLEIEGDDALSNFDVFLADSLAETVVGTPWERYSNIVEAANRIALDGMQDKLAVSRYWQKGVSYLQTTVAAPVSSILKNQNVGDIDTNLASSDLLKKVVGESALKSMDEWFNSNYSFASSEGAGIGTVSIDPEKRSRIDNFFEYAKDWGPDLTVGIGSMFVGPGSQLKGARSIGQSNKLLKNVFNLRRLSTLSRPISADIIATAGIQQAVGGVYQDVDMIMDMAFLSALDVIPTIKNTIGDFKFLNMDSQVAAKMLGDKFTLSELDHAKRVQRDLENAIYKYHRRDPENTNKLLKSAYVRNKLNEYISTGTTKNNVREIEGMLAQYNDVNQNILDMFKYDRKQFVDRTSGKDITGGLKLGPYSTVSPRGISVQPTITQHIPNDIKNLGVNDIDQVFTLGKAQEVATGLGKSVDDVFAKQGKNSYIIKDPGSLGIADSRSLSRQIQSNMMREMIEESKGNAEAFYDTVLKDPTHSAKAVEMRSSGAYEYVFNSMKNLLC